MAIIEIGTNSSDHGAPVVRDSSKLVNQHVICFGESGCGKTYLLRRMISQIAGNKAPAFLYLTATVTWTSHLQ